MATRHRCPVHCVAMEKRGRSHIHHGHIGARMDGVGRCLLPVVESKRVEMRPGCRVGAVQKWHVHTHCHTRGPQNDSTQKQLTACATGMSIPAVSPFKLRLRISTVNQSHRTSRLKLMSQGFQCTTAPAVHMGTCHSGLKVRWPPAGRVRANKATYIFFEFKRRTYIVI